MHDTKLVNISDWFPLKKKQAFEKVHCLRAQSVLKPNEKSFSTPAFKRIGVLKFLIIKSSCGGKRTTLGSLFFLRLIKEIIYKVRYVFCSPGAIRITFWRKEHAEKVIMFLLKKIEPSKY